MEKYPASQVKFGDVAGCDGAKTELVEVVDFLKNASRWPTVNLSYFSLVQSSSYFQYSLLIWGQTQDPNRFCVEN